MPKGAVFTMTLEPELRDAFMAEAGVESSHRPAAQLLRSLIRELVERQRQVQADTVWISAWILELVPTSRLWPPAQG